MAKITLKDNVQAARYINDFLHVYARTHKNSSEHTLKSYEMTLKSYMTFLQNEKKITPGKFSIKCFRKQLISEWLDWLQNKKNLSAQTCNTRLSNLRTFLKYVKEQDPKAASLYFEAMEVKKRPATAAGTKDSALSKEALQILLSLPDKSKQTERRDWMLMALAYVTAMKMSELLNLKMKDLHLEEKKPYISIPSKRNKDHPLYLDAGMVKEIEDYIKEFHSSQPNPEDYFFYSRNAGRQGPLSPEAAKKRLYKYGVQGHQKHPGIPENLHSHQLRKARAAHWLQEGYNLMQVSFLLGHSSLEMTADYLGLSKEEKEKAMKVLEAQSLEASANRAAQQEEILADFAGEYPLDINLDDMEDL